METYAPPLSRAHAIRDQKARNLALIREDVAARSSRFRGMPPIVSLHTTEICNLGCIMCARSVVPGKLKLARGPLRKLCDDVFPTALKAIVPGALGEPLLGDFDLIVEKALEHEVMIDLVTNGTLLTLDRYRRARSALNELNVSLDSHRREVYEHIRVGGDFDVLHANLDAIAAERRRHPDGVVLSFSAVVMNSNLDHLAEFVRFSAKKGADIVAFQPLRLDYPLVPEEVVIPDTTARSSLSARCLSAVGDPRVDVRRVSCRLQRAHAEIRVAARETGMNVTFGDFLIPNFEARPIHPRLRVDLDSRDLCWNVAYNMAVFPNGDVFPCCHPTPYRLGNLHSESPAEIWNGATVQGLREAHFRRIAIPACAGCIFGTYLTEQPA